MYSDLIRFERKMQWLDLYPGPVAKELRLNYLTNKVKIQQSQAIARTHDNSTALWECLHTFYPIAEFLSPIEIIGLGYLNKDFKLDKRMKELYTSRFEMNVMKLIVAKGHPLLAEILTTISRPWPFVISGSIVLQALLSETWESYDIDLYGRKDELKKLEYLLRKNMYISFFNAETQDQYIQLEVTKSIKEVINWYNLARKEYNNLADRACIVQIIELNDHIEQAADCVQSFDLSVVKNSWNGITIYVDDYESLLSKASNVSDHIELIVDAMGNGCGSFAAAFERIHQLQRKEILNINLKRMNLVSSHAAVVNFFDKIFSRFLKYARRGFVIKSKGRIWETSEISLILTRLRKSPTTKKRWALFNQVRKLQQQIDVSEEEQEEQEEQEEEEKEED